MPNTRTLTFINLMTMTKIKIALISAVVIAVAATPFVLQHQSKLREQNQTLQQKLEQLSTENQRLSNQVAQAGQAPEAAGPEAVAAANAAAVRLQTPAAAPAPVATNAAGTGPKTNDSSIIAGMTAEPQMRKLIRDRQKAGMEIIYKGLAKQLNLTPEQAGHLNDVLADDVMENIDQITKVLREGKTTEQMSQVFAAQDAALQEKVKATLGEDGYAQYRDYTHNLLSTMTTEQFKGELPADKPMSEDQAKQFLQVLQDETRSAIGRAGLGPDYQPVPMLNFRNIASEELMNTSLELLDEIYNNTAARAASFLGPEELTKFGEFRTNAMNLNRMALNLNRKMMAPAAP